MKLATSLLAIALTTFAVQESRAVELFDFKSSDYSIDDGSTTFTYSQTESGLNITGDSIGSQVTVLFNTGIDTSTLNEFRFYGTINNSISDTAITVHLYDDEYNLFEYTAFLNWGTGANWFTLTPSDPFTAGPLTLAAFTFTTNNGAEAFDYTFESIEAVPEPSVYALTFLAAGGAYLLRRRRAMSNR